MRTIQQRLAELHNRPTRYEVVAEHPERGRLLVGYTMHPSRPGMLHCMRRYPESLIAVCEIGDRDEISWHGKGRLGHYCKISGSGWLVRFSGRTERQAVLEGENESIRDVAAEVQQ